ncbi:hypothetical protein DPEC_G00218210 [Dallia pectoralis]|uniref:Uncharacterized protein n=1 Tax=Dallia pectoralis TaxID=75939 RepID=A0ACC2G382_DALPE|nr:hypothetical protein DPEC_G00218210 [Dallia pectoralis]
MPLPPYSGQRSRGPVQNQTGCAVETDASAGQKVPNRNPTQRYAQVLKSDTASSSPVPNHCIQFQGQQNCDVSNHGEESSSISNAFEIGKRSEKNNVLQFSVLPETFNFKDEPAPMDTPAPNSSRKEMTDPVSLETKSPEVKVNGAPGGWTKCHKIPRKSTTTEGTKSSFTLFQEFLKKVKQK